MKTRSDIDAEDHMDFIMTCRIESFHLLHDIK